MTPDGPPPIEAAAAALRRARRVVVLTGAGVSAESGVPTFRDALTGLWSRYRAEDLATPQAFLANPKLVWDWYAARREKLAQVEPNDGHRALARLEALVDDLLVVTQNVDGLHHRAGSRNVLELHGRLDRTLCFREGTESEPDPSDTGTPPRCPRCGAHLRPGVVWFGEALPAGAFDRACEAAAAADLCLSVGTSGLVEPAASIPRVALGNGVPVIEVNPDATPLTASATWHLRGASGVVLPQLVELAFGSS